MKKLSDEAIEDALEKVHRYLLIFWYHQLIVQGTQL
jgi:hypothetical protein